MANPIAAIGIAAIGIAAIGIAAILPVCRRLLRSARNDAAKDSRDQRKCRGVIYISRFADISVAIQGFIRSNARLFRAITAYMTPNHHSVVTSN